MPPKFELKGCSQSPARPPARPSDVITPLGPENEETDFHPSRFQSLPPPNPCRSVTDPAKRIANRMCRVPMQELWAGRAGEKQPPPQAPDPRGLWAQAGCVPSWVVAAYPGGLQTCPEQASIFISNPAMKAFAEVSGCF